MDDKIFYKRNLPHFQPLDYTYFITFRLANSLPVLVVNRLKEEYNKRLKEFESISIDKYKNEQHQEYKEEYFYRFDEKLNSTSFGNFWLKIPEVARIVEEAIHYRNKKKYDLIAYTIMPNHVHIIFTPIVERIADSLKVIKVPQKSEQNSVSPYIVTKILQDLKKFTANKANQFLNRSGAFWQHESYDHVIRNEKELKNLVKYILMNPVKANLVNKWEDWKWNYLNQNKF